MVEEVGRSRAWLRRHARGECPAMPGEYSYHQAMTQVEDVETVVDDEGYYAATPAEDYRGDPRWPTRCACGREFDQVDFGRGFGGGGDAWQVLTHALYRRVDGGAGEWPVRDLPPGAMFDAQWLPWKGPDGLSLSVSLPPDEPDGHNHVWHVDGPSSSGGHWTRTGTPPNITASPSILTGKYHGFLQGGVLTDSLPDRPLPRTS